MHSRLEDRRRRDKGCPNCAVLGPAEDGFIGGVPPGSYTRSKDNKQYTLNAVAALRNNPTLVSDTDQLWRTVMKGEQKQHNEQMTVVAALWQNEDIDGAT